MQLDIVSKHRGAIYGLSILWVVIFHGADINKVDYTFGNHVFDWLQSIISVGNIGVDVFLLLSGVSLYFSFHKNPDAYAFIKRRAVRIIPPVLIVFGVYWAVRCAMKGSAADFIGRITLLQFWLTGDQSIWFVSLIAVLYLLYPYIHWFLFAERVHTNIRFLVLIASAYVVVVSISFLAPAWYKQVEIALTRIPVFLVGCWLGRFVYEKKRVPALFGVLAVALSIFFVFVLESGLLRGTARRFFYLVGGLSLAYAFALLFELLEKSSLAKETILKPLSFVGAFSLELYLTHIAINQIWRLGQWYVKGSLVQYVCVAIAAIIAAFLVMRLTNFIVKKIRA